MLKEHFCWEFKPHPIEDNARYLWRETLLQYWLPYRRWGFIPNWLQPEGFIKDIIYTIKPLPFFGEKSFQVCLNRSCVRYKNFSLSLGSPLKGDPKNKMFHLSLRHGKAERG
jgi:hypothetical protein